MLYADDLTLLKIPGHILNKISTELVLKYYLMPIAEEEHKLIIVTSQTDNYKILPRLLSAIGCEFDMYLTEEGNLEKGINHHYLLPEPFKIPIRLRLDSTQHREERAGAKLDKEDNAVIVQILNNILKDAIDQRASDIHILPTSDMSVILFRINGSLIDYSSIYRIKSVAHPQIINRIKVICIPEMDVSNTVMMQDGAFEVQQEKGSLDCRVSTTPGVHGEKVVIRLHNSSKSLKSLEQLGFIKEDLNLLHRLLDEPQGMFLVTGPTSSGKTTTLYACLKRFNERKNVIMTIEDPVEMKIEGYVQVQVRHSEDEKLNLTFAKALRTALRQDPDILLVGEIRDNETATVALEASQTGHIMFSTLHTKNAISTLSRLMNMGVDRTTLLSEIVCIIAQRLVGTNCHHCSEPHKLTDKEKSCLNVAEIRALEAGKLTKGRGCERCKNTGFIGRTVVAEFLIFDNDLRDFLLDAAKIQETLSFLKEKKGFKTMWEKGLHLVERGITTVAELTNNISRN